VCYWTRSSSDSALHNSTVHKTAKLDGAVTSLTRHGYVHKNTSTSAKQVLDTTPITPTVNKQRSQFVCADHASANKVKVNLYM
jgi:hypothetical protein